MRLFFYGTLMDRDVLSLVLGRPVPRERFRAATLRDHERRAISGETFPAIRRARGGTVQGVVVDGLTDADLVRLEAYEGAGYALARGTVDVVGAGPRGIGMFVVKPGAYRLADVDWDVEQWRAAHKPATLDALRRARVVD